MFDFFKQMNQLREIQSAVKNEIVTVERDGVKVTMRGDMSVQEVILSDSLPAESQGNTVRDLVNEAMAKLQRIIAEKLSQHRQ